MLWGFRNGKRLTKNLEIDRILNYFYFIPSKIMFFFATSSIRLNIKFIPPQSSAISLKIFPDNVAEIIEFFLSDGFPITVRIAISLGST